MSAFIKFFVPLIVVAGSVAGLTPAVASSTATAAPTGISFVGPVTPLDMKRSTDVFPGGLYLNAETQSAAAAARLRGSGQTASAALIRQISDQPTAIWLGDWYTNAQLKTYIARHVKAAAQQKKTPVFVTYAISNRDCGGHSAGGLEPAAYLEWNRTVATALKGTNAVVIVEPDAIAMLTNGDCPGERDRRLSTMSKAVDILAAAKLTLYIDAGHSNWTPPKEMAGLLRAAGIDKARGFATNVSNYRLLADERAYGDRLSAELGGKAYVVDISRNGAGWKGDWCNPTGAALGDAPRVVTNMARLDALLWIKLPGESDGNCNGGPSAGTWWESYALDLVRNRQNR